MRFSDPKGNLFRMAMMVFCFGFGLHAAGCGPFSSGRNVPAAMPEAQPDAPETYDDAPQAESELSNDPAEPASVTPTPAPAAEPSPGYRVQLYSFTNREAAEAALKQVERTLAEWFYSVYLQEEAGSFKVRVGDFADKVDADTLRDWFRRQGFVDAWTASTLIQTP